MTHDKATEGRTGAAAVDQAIALATDEAFDLRAKYRRIQLRHDSAFYGPMKGARCGCEYCQPIRDLLRCLDALRVLADAVEELRAETVPREFSITQQETIIELRERAEAAEAEAEELREDSELHRIELHHANAKRRNAEELSQPTIKRNILVTEANRRLARQVADLERAYRQACTNLATIRPDLSRDLSIGETADLYYEALLAGWCGIEGYPRPALVETPDSALLIEQAALRPLPFVPEHDPCGCGEGEACSRPDCDAAARSRDPQEGA